MNLRALLARLLKPGLAGNIGANGLGQVIQIFIQLVSVPVYAHYLGVTNYGVWLIFFTIPAYLAFSDFGLTIAAGNDMTMCVARGEIGGARTTYRAMRRGINIIILALLASAWLLLFVARPHLLDFATGACGGKPREVLLLLLGYGLAALQGSTTFAAFRANGEYSVAAYRMQWISLVEALGAIIMALIGQGLPGMALAYFATRLTGTIWLQLLLHRRAPSLIHGSSDPIFGRIRKLAPFAAAAVVLPIANGVILQGMVAVLAAVAGPAAVPAFAAARTLTRLPVQLAALVNLASLPDYTAGDARGDDARKTDLVALTLLAIAITLLPAAVLFALWGKWLLLLWSNGVLEVAVPVVLALVISMVTNGCWVPLSNFMLAINRHARFTYVYLALSLAALGMARFFIPEHGALGAAIAVAALDVTMLAFVAWQCWQLHIVDFFMLRTAPVRAWRLVAKQMAWRPENL